MRRFKKNRAFTMHDKGSWMVMNRFNYMLTWHFEHTIRAILHQYIYIFMVPYLFLVFKKESFMTSIWVAYLRKENKQVRAIRTSIFAFVGRCLGRIATWLKTNQFCVLLFHLLENNNNIWIELRHNVFWINQHIFI